jgi:hypothetical protein
MGEGGQGRMMEELNLIKIYFKHICTYHNVSPLCNDHMLIRKKEEFYKDTEFLKTSNKL